MKELKNEGTEAKRAEKEQSQTLPSDPEDKVFPWRWEKTNTFKKQLY